MLTPPCLCLGSLRQCDGLQTFTLHPHFCGEAGRDLHRGWSAQGALQRGAGWGCHGPVPLPAPRCGQNLFHWQCANWHEGKGTLKRGGCSGYLLELVEVGCESTFLGLSKELAAPTGSCWGPFLTCWAWAWERNPLISFTFLGPGCSEVSELLRWMLVSGGEYTKQENVFLAAVNH